MIRALCTVPLLLLVALAGAAETPAPAPVPLFDGSTFAGWEGAIGDLWRIEEGAIVTGHAGVKQAENDFLCTTREYGDFDLTLSYQNNRHNGGIQFRSQRVTGSHEVAGYQADFFKGGDGCLYDEARRRKMLGQPTPEIVAQLNLGTWNRYHIRAEGPRIRLWVNDVLTVDYQETDPAIARRGIIGLQIHKNAGEIRYKDLNLIDLDPPATR